MKRGLLFVALMTTCSSAALAQTLSGASVIALPEIVVNSNVPFNPYAGKFDGPVANTSDVTGLNKPIMDTPRSVYVVTPTTLHEQMPQSLAQAVQTIPGTYIGNTNGGNSDFITVKGFEVNTTDSFLVGNGNGLLVDGIRAPFDRAFNANTESVELLSGPASYMYGYAAEGGVINVNRKLPLPEAHYSVDVLGTATTGSFKGVGSSFDFTGPIYKSTEGVFAYRLVGSGSITNPWRTGDAISRDGLLAPTFAFYSKEFNAVIAYEHAANQLPYDRGDTSFNNAPLNIPATVSYSEAFSTYSERSDWVHGHFDYNMSKDTDFHLRYSWSSTLLKYNQVRSDAQTDFDPVSGNINRSEYTNGPYGAVTEQGLLGASAVHRFDSGPLHHEFQVGADYYLARQSEADEFFTAPPVGGFNLYNPVYGQFNPGTFLDLGQLVGNPQGQPLSLQKIRESGFFGQDAVTYGPLTLTGGGRFTEIYQYEHYAGITQSDNTYHIFLPSASALYKITPNVALFADYAQSFHPNIYAVGSALPFAPGMTVNPQQGIGYEGGIKWKLLEDRVLAQVSVFRIDKTNVQTVNPDGQLTFDAKQRSEGASISVVGRVTPNIDLNVAYSHQSVHTVSDLASNNDLGAQVINAPADIYTVFGAYHFLDGPLNHLSFMAGVTGASKNPVDAQNSFFLPSFTTANLGTSYEYQPNPAMPKMTFSFKVDNLFNSNYYPSTGSKTNWITVGEPRNYLLDLNIAL